MRTYINLVGQKFGRLIAMERISSNSFGDTIWKCKCDCGNIVFVSAKKLKSGNTQSCGCLNRERASEMNRLPYGEAAFNKIEKNYKAHAIKLKVVYELTREQLRENVTKFCHYCGNEPSNVSKRKTSYGLFVYNGLDRIDNNKGYTLDNIVTCCKKCNKWKGKMTQNEFLEHAERIHNYNYKI
jgi:hypothetical protein